MRETCAPGSKFYSLTPWHAAPGYTIKVPDLTVKITRSQINKRIYYYKKNHSLVRYSDNLFKLFSQHRLDSKLKIDILMRFDLVLCLDLFWRFFDLCYRSWRRQPTGRSVCQRQTTAGRGPAEDSRAGAQRSPSLRHITAAQSVPRMRL